MGRLSVSVEMYYKMAAYAAKHKISVAEVHVTLLRDILEREHGFRCNHFRKIRISKNGRAYCRGCWRFMREEQKPDYMKKSFIPLKTFIEKEREEQAKAIAAANVNPVTDGLKPDQRGGE